MRLQLKVATADDVLDIVALRAAVAGKLTADFGRGRWSGVSTEKGVLFDMRNSKLFVARQRNKLVASFRLATKKPWAIDRKYFTPCNRPLLLPIYSNPYSQRVP